LIKKMLRNKFTHDYSP